MATFHGELKSRITVEAYSLREFAACNGRIKETQKVDFHSFRNVGKYICIFSKINFSQHDI